MPRLYSVHLNGAQSLLPSHQADKPTSRQAYFCDGYRLTTKAVYPSHYAGHGTIARRGRLAFYDTV
jgi:hypothetical protein